MLDHISLSLTDIAKAQAFYAKALAPLGYKLVSEYEGGFGIGAEGGSTIWASKGPAQKPIAHLAFRAKDRKQVDAFHKAALAAGGRDNGKPGLRENYSPTYYAAFVLDQDGNNVEAVCHDAK
ncbi:MAG TPA: VOC family protein [Gammaproteobacteria bacterium]|jgi:catechol 2,3-dioxygenase-like lactoylglutathione lyase family enzyme|nr:VOC family protein [Gammaproteobacteria bacterium]